MAIETVIFDCDGVLFDSRQANKAHYSALAQDFGREPLSPEEEDYVHVHTVFESVDHIFRDNPQVIDQAHKVRVARGYGPFLKLMIPEPGIYDCLEDLQPDYNLALLTNRSDTIGGVLRAHRMTQYFKQVVSCLDVAKPKPDPEGVFKILEANQTAPQGAVYVGDALSDAQTAQAAGIFFIAYKNPSLKGEASIDHFNQLRAVLESL